MERREKKTTKVAKSKKEREKNEERRYGEKRNLLPYDYLLVGLLEVQLLFCAFDKIYIESIRINKHTTHGAVYLSYVQFWKRVERVTYKDQHRTELNRTHSTEHTEREKETTELKKQTDSASELQCKTPLFACIKHKSINHHLIP